MSRWPRSGPGPTRLERAVAAASAAVVDWRARSYVDRAESRWDVELAQGVSADE